MAKKALAQHKNTEIFNYIYMGTFALMPLVFKSFEDSAQDPGLYPRHMLLAISTVICGIILFTRKTKNPANWRGFKVKNQNYSSAESQRVV